MSSRIKSRLYLDTKEKALKCVNLFAPFGTGVGTLHDSLLDNFQARSEKYYAQNACIYDAF